ncbi:Dyp-type peroxidase [Sulfitobacter sp. TB366]|uniref:Dyp-type peroxidase n=1 Tax=unclassified Sulfitobacter TaxID=196795 RepID=UPI003745BA9B
MPDTKSQSVNSPLTRYAIFLVVLIAEDDASEGAAKELLGDVASLVRSVGFRSAEGQLSCVTGLGASLWDRLVGAFKPNDLHVFRELRGVHHAPATPGDMLFHIRADRMDLCFELGRRILERLGDKAVVADQVQGFSYFDRRDLLGFVDGTENPSGEGAAEATLVGPEDAAFAGGSYVIVQKYLHDLAAWERLPVEQQEKFVGRRKFSDVELTDDEKPDFAHNALTSITNENGEEQQILRDNMPFGDISKGEFGTYFIGYAKSPERIERMLENMFIGNPPGNYDRLLDFSRAMTGTLFFVPSESLLERLGDGASVPVPETTRDSNTPARSDGSLGIGSLKGGEIE